MRSLLPLATAAAVTAATAAVVTLPAPAAHAAPASTAYALRGTQLVSFNPASPAQVTAASITGVTAGETLVDLDVRPQNGQLYALGVNATADTATLYHLSEQTAYAAVVGTAGSIAFTSDGTTAVDLPDPATVGYGLDFNPAVDRVRVVAGSLNFRANPNTGGPVDGDNGGAAASVTGTNPDGAVNGGTTHVDGAAYTNNRPDNGNVTTLYTLDSTADAIYLQNPPNAGTQTAGETILVGGQPLDFSSVGGFDIDASTDAPAANAPVEAGVGYAALTVGGTSSLYAIDLTTGNARAFGVIGDGTPVTGLALQRNLADAGQPVVGLDTVGTNLVRFRTKAPGTTSSTALTGTTLGETIAAVTWRPQTGQLYALGVNATADTGTLYLADPQTGALTVVGTAGSLAWDDGPLIPGVPVPNPTDLPDPATTGYGFDVNPTVDRIRISAGTLNARVNPITGAPVDGDNGGAAASVTGTNPDGSPTTALTATAYTNAWGRDLTVAGATTTQYVLDPAGNQLLVQNPSNAGTLTLARTVTLDGAPLDFAAPAGFDIDGTIGVTASGTNATGRAVAVLTVGGTAGLYAIDLTSGAAALAGPITPALRSIALGEAQVSVATPPPAPVKVPATLKGGNPAVQRKRVVDTNRVLVCPNAFANATCTTTVTLRAAGGRPLGKATFRVTRGTQQRLKVTLSQTGVKRVRQLKRAPSVITIVYPGGAKATARTTRLRITLLASKL